MNESNGRQHFARSAIAGAVSVLVLGLATGRDLATCYHNVGFLLHATQRSADALEFLSKARRIPEEFLDGQPENLDYRSELAGCLNDIGLAWSVLVAGWVMGGAPCAAFPGIAIRVAALSGWTRFQPDATLLTDRSSRTMALSPKGGVL